MGLAVAGEILRQQRLRPLRKDPPNIDVPDQKCRLIFDGLDDAVFIADIETGRILDANRQADSPQDWLQCDAIAIRVRRGDDFPYFHTRGFSDAFIASESSPIICRL